MVLESIIDASRARSHPVMMLVASFVIATVAMWLSYYISKDGSSLLTLAFVMAAFMPTIHAIFVMEEESESDKPGWAGSFLKRHFCVVKLYSYFFIGLVLCYAFWYVVLPAETPGICAAEDNIVCFMPAKEDIFSEQEKVWGKMDTWKDSVTEKVTGRVTGLDHRQCIGSGKNFVGCTEFIFLNNALVLGLAILFSFVYGAGALFLIGWNASVIGIFIGKEVLDRSLAHGVMRAFGYLPHGIPEVAGYFIGAIAGGIISAGLSTKKFGTRRFEVIAKDALVLILLAYFVLFIAAAVEAWLIVAV